MRAVPLLVIVFAVSAMGGCFLEVSENKTITGTLVIYSNESLYTIGEKGALHVLPGQYQVNLTKTNDVWNVKVDGISFIARKIYTNVYTNVKFIIITNETSDIHDIIDVLCVQSPTVASPYVAETSRETTSVPQPTTVQLTSPTTSPPVTPVPDTNETLWQRFLMFVVIMLTSALVLMYVALRRRRGGGADIEEISV